MFMANVISTNTAITFMQSRKNKMEFLLPLHHLLLTIRLLITFKTL